MKLSFSTLGCPAWTLRQVIDLARRERYDGVELRFIEGDAALWKRPEFTGAGLAGTVATFRDAGLVVAEPVGRYSYYRLRADALVALSDTLANLAARAGSAEQRPRPCD